MTFLRMPKIKPELPSNFREVACPCCGQVVESHYYWQQEFKPRNWCGNCGSSLWSLMEFYYHQGEVHHVASQL